jgi:hypothetical protein
MAISSKGNGNGSGRPTLGQRLSRAVAPPAKTTSASDPSEPDEVLSPSERRAAMSTIDATEIKWSKAGLVLSAVFAVFLPIYAKTLHAAKGKSTSASNETEALLLGGVALILCIVGLIGLLRRKRSLLAFSFFLAGFDFTLTFAPLGLALIFLGGWLMLRAYRIQKYGSANTKVAARQAAARPPRRERKKAAATPVKPSGYKPPVANKRYTPKAPPRKKVAKPTE